MTDEPRKGSLLVIFLTVFIDLLGFGLVLPLLPVYAEHYLAESSGAGIQLGLLMASFSAMQFIFAPFWGKLSDRHGRRPIIMVGLAGSVACYTLFGMATTIADDPSTTMILLYVSRIGAGIFGATISTAQAYIADTTTPEKRSKGMALIGMAFGAGFTFGPLLGMAAVAGDGEAPSAWPGYIAAVLSFFALLLASKKLPESLTESSESAGHKLFDFEGLRQALSIPSISLILVSIFVCIFSFANFETTLSLLIKGSSKHLAQSPFEFTYSEICGTFAFIGVTLSLVQGGIVRRLAGRRSDASLAITGATFEIIGFAIMIIAINQESSGILYLALGIVVTGFSFMQPSLNAILSRRSDPSRQGTILGVGQSVSSLARIIGSGVGIPLLTFQLNMPYYVATVLMILGVLLIAVASKSGKDFAPKKQETSTYQASAKEADAEQSSQEKSTTT